MCVCVVGGEVLVSVYTCLYIYANTFICYFNIFRVRRILEFL